MSSVEQYIEDADKALEQMIELAYSKSEVLSDYIKQMAKIKVEFNRLDENLVKYCSDFPTVLDYLLSITNSYYMWYRDRDNTKSEEDWNRCIRLYEITINILKQRIKNISDANQRAIDSGENDLESSKAKLNELIYFLELKNQELYRLTELKDSPQNVSED